MAKIKARRVATPGSTPVAKKGKKMAHKLSPGRGRPKKFKSGSSRKNNYRHTYQLDALKQAVAAVKEEGKSIRDAAAHFQVPRSTLSDWVTGVTQKKVGRPKELEGEEEEILAERCELMATWGYPLTKKDLCNVTKDYLDSRGKTVPRYGTGMGLLSYLIGKNCADPFFQL
jgi:transposase-like protein